MEKLTLEHIAYYYPHKVKVIHNNDGFIREIQYLNSQSIEVTPAKRGYKCMSIKQLHNEDDNFKLLLRYMNLTQPIIVEGEEIIPIVELSKIAYNTEWFYKVGNYNATSSAEVHGFEYNETGFEMYNQISGGFLPVKNQLALFQWLFRHKFDVFGLIEKGLAIDVNTLTTNPYN